MFTGIITAVGTVRSARRGREGGGGLSLTVAVPVRGPAFAGLGLGESVAVDGACLTVAEKGRGWFRVRVVETSLDRTGFAAYRRGRRVNLERALQAGDRLGGHLVQGHVDGLGRVRSVRRRADAVVVDLEAPAGVHAVSIPLGSVTVDGVSLTVIECGPRRRLRVALIPFTLRHTTLGRLAPGDEVHLEADLIGKYVHQLMPASGRGGGRARRGPRA